jgi:hypothetical protein
VEQGARAFIGSIPLTQSQCIAAESQKELHLPPAQT